MVDSVATFMAYVLKSVNEMSKVYLQNERRHNYTTPKSFLELIALYKKLLTETFHKTITQAQMYHDGTVKIENCDEQVAKLKAALAVSEEVLREKNELADAAISRVNEKNERVQADRDDATEREKEIRLFQEDVAAKKKLCDEELRKVEPTLEAARGALKKLNRNNLTELKSFGSPPQLVIKVCQAVLILKSAPTGKIPKDKSWKQCKVRNKLIEIFDNTLIS